jgi:ornithine cyclodeaminase/alanine dehydrogenase-like protein (mu-crystallin family)
MEEMYAGAAGDLEIQPGRQVTRVNSDSAILTMPSYSPRLNRFAVKIVTEFKKNPQAFGLRRQGGITILMDGRNARVLALVDSASLTAVRTGAVSGLATKLLSRKDSQRVGLLGSGEQARTQLEAVCEVRSIREARVYSPHLVHARRFALEMAEKTGVEVTPCHDPSQAAAGADILIAATNSASPVLHWEDVPSGCHITSIGTLPDRAELAPEVISRSSVYVDTVEGVFREAGDVILAVKEGLFSRDRVVADLAGLVRRPALGRKRDDEVTLFKSVGFGLQDLYACSYLFDKVSSNPRRYHPQVWTARLPQLEL